MDKIKIHLYTILLTMLLFYMIHTNGGNILITLNYTII